VNRPDGPQLSQVEAMRVADPFSASAS